jgi:sugar/nucleoside kinase (ribokinase family)
VHYRLIEEITARAKDFDVVLVNDFGHGMITPGVRHALYENSKFLALNVQTNAGNFGYNLATKYARADYLCLDAPEARLAVTNKSDDLNLVAHELAGRMDTGRIILTHGSNGCLTYNAEARPVKVSRVPAFTRRVVDTMGAGDAFFAVTGPLASITDDLDVVGFVGNAVGAIKVGILGHRKAVDKAATLAYIRTLLK